MNKDTRIIKFLSVVIGIAAIILSIGSVGGLEQNTMSIKNTCICQVMSWIMFLFAIKTWDRMKFIEEGRCKHHGSRKTV